MEPVVVSAAGGVLQILLRKLGGVITSRYALVCGVSQEIQELKDDLESINTCLRVLAGSDDQHSEETKTWMKQVRELAFDAEDHIDIFWLHQEGHQDRDTNFIMVSLRGIIRPLTKLVDMYRLAKKIQGLNARAVKVRERRLRYNVEAAGGAATLYAHAACPFPDYSDRDCPSALNIDESQLVQSEGATKFIKDVEEDNSGPLKVFSIVGSGGLGKTTLALTIYKRPAVKGIPARAFVTVSRVYNPHVLLPSLLKQLAENASKGPNRFGNEETTEEFLKDIETWDISKLMRKCNTYLQHKRYFIVLDDVWDPEDWARMKAAFPDNGKHSRILITTRTRNVTQSSLSSTHVHEMEPLPREKSRELFLKRVFRKNYCPPALEEISEDILKKCDDLPLAIVSIGGMLARMENKIPAEWQKVYNRMGDVSETSGTVEKMRRILSLSYNDLPYYLKACFLYFSIFPEDYEIKRGPLIRQWVAEGFISGAHDMEKVAGRYLDEFVNRSIVTPTRVSTTGMVKAFKVHDIMLEVITNKSIQENFISLMGNQQYMATGHDKIRRLSIRTCDNGSTREEDMGTNFSHARSLSILHCKDKPLPVIHFARLKLLRVLDLKGCQWLSTQDLKRICKLSLLRYLCLRGTNLKTLPQEVGKLKRLWTLDVRETSITTLPEAITELGRLKHLLGGRYHLHESASRVKCVVADAALKIPPGLKKMKSLRKIAHIDIGSSSCKLEELSELSQVTKLSVTNKEPGGAKWEPFAASWSKLCSSIRQLSIAHLPNGDEKGLEVFISKVQSTPVFLEKLYLWGRLRALPPWILNHRNLVDLSLRESFLGEEPLRRLGELPSLLSLRLYSQSYTGKKLKFIENQFPNLKHLIIDNLPHLKELSFEGGATNLEKLTLAFFKHPTRGISGIKELKNLKEIEFFGGVIVDSLVREVRAEAMAHPNRPRFYIRGQPTEETSPGRVSSNHGPVDVDCNYGGRPIQCILC